MPHVKKITLLFLLLFALTGCIPGAQQLVQSPTFVIIDPGAEVLSFELPLLGSGNAVFRLHMQVTNPNTFALNLAGINFDFFVNDKLAISSSFTEGVNLVAGGSSPLVLDITVPLLRGVELVSDISALLAGASTSFALQGTVSVDVFGGVQVLPSATLVSGQFN